MGLTNDPKANKLDRKGSESVLPAGLRFSRLAVLLSYFGLLLTFTVSSLQRLEPGNAVPILVLWLLRSAPLLIFLPGLLRRHLRTHAWLCFVVLLYFTLAVLDAFDPSIRTYGIIESLLCAALFTSLIAYIRYYRRQFQVSL